jgi:cytochrome P450
VLALGLSADAPSSFDGLEKMPLSEMAFKEALRIKPPVPSMPRRAMRDFSFKGFDGAVDDEAVAVDEDTSLARCSWHRAASPAPRLPVDAVPRSQFWRLRRRRLPLYAVRFRASLR